MDSLGQRRPISRAKARKDPPKMATWHQQQRPVQLFHATEWTVVIDPPNQMTHLYRTSTKALAEVYMRNLKANNPAAHKHAYVLRPAKTA